MPNNCWNIFKIKPTVGVYKKITRLPLNSVNDLSNAVDST